MGALFGLGVGIICVAEAQSDLELEFTLLVIPISVGIITTACTVPGMIIGYYTSVEKIENGMIQTLFQK
ncbi:hypothetical protein JXI42_13570 [bacterium]|nr:hypothetical protein [bacterium]